MNTTMTTNKEQREADLGKPEETFQATFVPRFDIWEGEEELLLHGDLPGVATADLDIRFEENQLTIRGKVTPRHDGEYLFSEYGVGDFQRTFTVGETIDAENISAEMRGGVLTLHLPKAEKAKPRRIKVTAK